MVQTPGVITMEPLNVLITGAGTTNAVTVLKGIQAMNDPSVRVLMGDIQPDCAGAYLGDEFVCMPLAIDPHFEERVIEICRKRRIDLVVPIIDYEFASWSRVAEQLRAAGTRVIISPPHTIAQCAQKDLTIQYLCKIRVPCPTTWRISEIKDPFTLPFPVFMKPRCGRGSLAANRADNLEEYLYYAARTEDLIVQPCLQGDEVTIDTISDLDGRFLAAGPRIRVEVKSGQAYRSVTIQAPELVAYAKRIVEGLPIIGPSNIQCFLTDRGPQFFEINPRFGAGTALSIKAGLNAPAALVAMARGKPIPELKPRPNVWMLRYWQEVFVERKGWPIFFDLDGPILDVSHRHYQLYRDLLEEAGKSAVPFEQYWQDKRACRPQGTIVSQTTGEDFCANTFQQQWLDRIETDKYLALDRVWPWAIDVLAALYRDHPLYLVTVRSEPDQLRKQMDQLHLTRWFQAILCRPARQNAAQEKVKAIREQFDTLPQQALMVGDTEADIECGKELGFVTVGVLSGIRNQEHLQATGCDYLRDNILALPHLVESLK
jgi:carbamoyl-phosphate synthase large subunit